MGHTPGLCTDRAAAAATRNQNKHLYITLQHMYPYVTTYVEIIRYVYKSLNETFMQLPSCHVKLQNFQNLEKKHDTVMYEP